MNHSTTATAVIDPVCGMTVEASEAAGSSSHDGQTYHFCSRSCQTKFDAAPAQYVAAAPAPAGASCCSTAPSATCCSPATSCC
jgi:Cu+-exporting ATPase